MQALQGLVGLGCLVCWIIVLIKQFKIGGVVQGIIGIICGLWAFIWGWMNADRAGLKTIMMVWSLLIVLSIILGAAFGGFNFHYSVGTP